MDDPRKTYDEARDRCPIAHDGDAWTFYGHQVVRDAALDDATFSSATSHHLHVPNAMDGAEHDRYRALIDRYLSPDRVDALADAIKTVAADCVAEIAPGSSEIDAVALGQEFAVRTACDWLGWPRDLGPELLEWVDANHLASGSGSAEANAIVAKWYDQIIARQIGARRRAGDDAPDDVTTELMRDDSLGRPLTDAEITSILRNWTGGDLSSMALCIGVVCAFLADNPDVQARLRLGDVSDAEFNAILDEILRIDDPFVANKRVATRDVEVAGQTVAAGDRVVLNWTAANRDPAVFGGPDGAGDPDRFDPAGNAGANLVYGIGRHVCPGRGLATAELRLFMRELLAATDLIAPASGPGRERVRAQPPAGGYDAVPLLVRVRVAER